MYAAFKFCYLLFLPSICKTVLCAYGRDADTFFCLHNAGQGRKGVGNVFLLATEREVVLSCGWLGVMPEAIDHVGKLHPGDVKKTREDQGRNGDRKRGSKYRFFEKKRQKSSLFLKSTCFLIKNTFEIPFISCIIYARYNK